VNSPLDRRRPICAGSRSCTHCGARYDEKVGDSCAMLGPRDSLDVNTLDHPALLSGDETSFGLADAMRFTPQGVGAVHVVLEVTWTKVAEDIPWHLGITNRSGRPKVPQLSARP
jgi:hypothetical protein